MLFGELKDGLEVMLTTEIWWDYQNYHFMICAVMYLR
jgi:hypothetical protein